MRPTKDPTTPDPFFSLSLQEQVDRAAPYARRVIVGSLEGTVDTDLETIVKSIAGKDGEEDEYTSAIFAARAFGLCQGLLLRSDAFSRKVTR